MNIEEWYEHAMTVKLCNDLKDEINTLSQMLVDMLTYSDDKAELIMKRFHQTQGIIGTKRDFLSRLTKPETEEETNDREKK